MADDLHPKTHPLFGPGTAAVVTGEYPRFPVATPGGNPGLQAELKASGLRHEQTEGSYGGDLEHPFIVHNPTREQAFDLGRRFGQEAVIFSENGRQEMLFTNGPHAGKSRIQDPGVQWFGQQPPDDYWTKVPGHGYYRVSFGENYPPPANELVDHLPHIQKSEPAIVWVRSRQ